MSDLVFAVLIISATILIWHIPEILMNLWDTWNQHAINRLELKRKKLEIDILEAQLKRDEALLNASSPLPH